MGQTPAAVEKNKKVYQDFITQLTELTGAPLRDPASLDADADDSHNYNGMIALPEGYELSVEDLRALRSPNSAKARDILDRLSKLKASE